MTLDTQQTPQRKRASRRLTMVRIVFYGSVSLFSLWILVSVTYQLVKEQGPLLHQRRISREADKPEEVFRCYFDTLLLFNALMDDFGRITTETRCREYSVKSQWDHVYGWDTYPFAVVAKSGRNTEQGLGLWRFHLYSVWSRCRLNDAYVRGRSPALAHLAKVHRDLDELRRALTRQVRKYNSTAYPLVKRIRSSLSEARRRLDRPRRRMKRERKLSRYRLRKWGIRNDRENICPIGF